MKMSKALRGNLDLQQIETYALPALSAGSASDVEHAIGYVTDLTKGAPSGTAGFQAYNAQQIRFFTLVWEATMTGQATNFFTMQFKQYRAGALLVNTTSSTTVSAAGSVQITVGSGAAKYCYIGQYLDISGGTGTAETVQVTAFDPVGNKITAVFANTHSGTYNVVATPLASLAYSSSSVTDIAWTPRQLAALPNTILPGDVITVKRLSNNATGLASVAATVGYEWVCAGPQ
jgi:hypothetical protein